MARSSKSTEVDAHASVRAMLRDLVAAGNLARSLEETAPGTVALYGGGDALVAAYGRPTGAWFWSLRPCPEELWTSMATEANERHRVCAGDD